MCLHESELKTLARKQNLGRWLGDGVRKLTTTPRREKRKKLSCRIKTEEFAVKRTHMIIIYSI